MSCPLRVSFRHITPVSKPALKAAMDIDPQHGAGKTLSIFQSFTA